MSFMVMYALGRLRDCCIQCHCSGMKTILGTKALVGRANRLLHMNDILSFKELGYSTYDWGGCSDENEDLRKIANFKRGFGRRSVLVYDALVPCSLFGKLVIKVKNLLSN